VPRLPVALPCLPTFVAATPAIIRRPDSPQRYLSDHLVYRHALYVSARTAWHCAGCVAFVRCARLARRAVRAALPLTRTVSGGSLRRSACVRGLVCLRRWPFARPAGRCALGLRPTPLMAASRQPLSRPAGIRAYIPSSFRLVLDLPARRLLSYVFPFAHSSRPYRPASVAPFARFFTVDLLQRSAASIAEPLRCLPLPSLTHRWLPVLADLVIYLVAQTPRGFVYHTCLSVNAFDLPHLWTGLASPLPLRTAWQYLCLSLLPYPGPSN